MEREDMEAKWRELAAVVGAEASPLQWTVLPRGEEGDSEEPPLPQFCPRLSPLSLIGGQDFERLLNF